METLPTVDTNTAQGISAVEQWAKSLTILSPEQHDTALARLKEVKALRVRIVEFFAPSKTAAAAAHKAIVANEKSFTDKLDSAEKSAKQALLKFQMAEEEKRIQEQRRLQAEADAAAAKERARLEKEAAKLKTPELREARLEQAAMVEAPVVRVETRVEAKGSSIRKTWKCRVVDPNAVPREWLVVNQQALDAFARSTKGAVKVAGCEMYEESGMSIRV